MHTDAPQPLETPLYPQHLALGARMSIFAGHHLPERYTGTLAEHEAVRRAVGIFDVSHMARFVVEGPGATDALNLLLTNDLKRLKPGQAQYTLFCREDGTTLDDLMVYPLAEDRLLLCGNAGNGGAVQAHLQHHLPAAITLQDLRRATGQIAVQGPEAPALLQRLLGLSEDLAPMRIREISFAGQTGLYATTGYTGERGGEITLPPEATAALWAALIEAQATPCGLGARDSLRLEMGYCLFGQELTAETTPLEAGLRWAVRFKKDAFIGKAALVAQRKAGWTRQLTAFTLLEKAIARPGYPVLVDGVEVGVVTSGALSPSTGLSIGLAYLPPAHAAVDQRIQILCRGRARNAAVVPLPFYRPTA